VTSFVESLGRIARDLDDSRHSWALVGALAVAAHAEARATLDVDVAVAVDGPEDAAGVIGGLRSRGYQWRADFGSAMSQLAVPDAAPPGLRLDVLFSLAGIEDEVARSAERLEVLPGLQLPVARRGDLIALKLLGATAPGREHDWRDVRVLLAGATAVDRARARSAIGLLVARGCAEPGRLEAELDRLSPPAP
jgi:hypothetical protein